MPTRTRRAASADSIGTKSSKIEKADKTNIGSSSQSIINKIILTDERIGLRLYNWTQNNAIAKLIADLISLSGDELIWFGISAGGGILMFSARGCGSLRPMGCVEEFLWDLFGGCCVCIFTESLLKITFQRKRPPYSTQGDSYVVYGEWFSFPSGHTVRAFYCMFYLSRSRFVRLLSPLIVFQKARRLIPWAIAVGVSRVAKGRHFPSDVIAGSVVGSLVGWLVEDQMNGGWRTVTKTIAGAYTVFWFGMYVVVPVFAGRKPHMAAVVITTLLYAAFAISLFITSLPKSTAEAGAQTIVDQEGQEVCKMFW